MVETARQNQCQFDYWSALSTQQEDAFKEQENANTRLKTQFPALKNSLTSAKFEDRSTILGSSSESVQQQAQAAQNKIVDQLVDSAYKIAKEERDLKHFLAQNPMYSADPKKSPKEHIEKAQARIAILENSFVLSEDKEVQAFVRYDIISKINESFTMGKEPDISELKDYFTSDKKKGFQNQVVKRKLSNISADQTNYASVDGKYDENYSFKVSAVQSGVGSKIINDKVAANPNFSQLQCELDSKYGKGEKIATTANTAVVAGVTMFFGGASLMVARLAQIGLTSYRAARMAQIISTVANTTISASEIVQGLVESCTQPHFTKKDSTICSRVASVKEKGIAVQIDSEINHSQCLNDMGLAALAGSAAFKTAMVAKRLKREQQILNLGIRDRYNSLQQSIKNHPTLTQVQKKQFEEEMRKSIDLSDMNNFPRQEFLATLAKDNPEDMIEALKQINGTTGLSWRNRVKTWISGKSLTKKEADELEACLVDQSSKTSQCNSIPKDRRS
ncbi:MAG: hypothetical protein B7Y39_13775 [Bdellovibrio sp. 28-41-41]|nr:MAG: hypothetical protein B7Y39_13775 [Bdellovibrio sp. 28-41-41]